MLSQDDGLLLALSDVEAALADFHAAYLAWSEAGSEPLPERKRLLAEAEARLDEARARLEALEAVLRGLRGGPG